MGRETRWNEEVAAALVEATEELPDTKVGKMFGHPALYATGKLFACAFGDGLGLKLPAEVVAALVEEEGFEPFRPYGKAGMREWAFLRATDRDAVRARSGLLEQSARLAPCCSSFSVIVTTSEGAPAISPDPGDRAARPRRSIHHDDPGSAFARCFVSLATAAICPGEWNRR